MRITSECKRDRVMKMFVNQFIHKNSMMFLSTKYDELCATNNFFMQISWWHINSATGLKKSLKSGT